MGTVRLRSKLGQKQRRDKPPVVLKLNHTDFILVILARNGKRFLKQHLAVVWIQSISTIEHLGGLGMTVGQVGTGARSNVDGLRFALQRTTQGRYQGRRSARRLGGIPGIDHRQSIAGILHQSMLKTASSSEKGPVIFARKPNGP